MRPDDLGQFVFDFPVWLIALHKPRDDGEAQVTDKTAFMGVQADVPCLAVFTETDFAERFIQGNALVNCTILASHTPGHLAGVIRRLSPAIKHVCVDPPAIGRAAKFVIARERLLASLERARNRKKGSLRGRRRAR
jgi:hypothetical protein